MLTWVNRVLVCSSLAHSLAALCLGENGTIVYSLLDYTQYFSIHPSTGQIDCVKALDHEQMSSIALHVLASDQGNELQLQSICTTLHLTVVDVNDNVPQFSSMSYAFDLFSDMPRYAIFGQIYATDVDTHDRLTYAVDPNPYVTINNQTGHLRLKHNLHRLIDQILNVTVKVSDGLHTNQTSIHVHVKSFVDAQQPILLAEPAYALTINESLGVGSTITNIYRRAQLIASTIDFIEIMTDDRPSPFSIDLQGIVVFSCLSLSRGVLILDQKRIEDIQSRADDASLFSPASARSRALPATCVTLIVRIHIDIRSHINLLVSG